MPSPFFSANGAPRANLSSNKNLHLIPCKTINTEGVSRSVVAQRIIKDLLDSKFYNEDHSFFKLRNATPAIQNQLLHESCFLANAPCALPTHVYKAIIDRIAWKLCTYESEFRGQLHKACGVTIDELLQIQAFNDEGFTYTEQNGENFLNEDTMCRFLNRYYCSSTSNFTSLLHIINIPGNFGHLVGLCGEGTAHGGISHVYVIDKTQKFNSRLYDQDRQAFSTDITAYIHAAGDPEHTKFFVLLASKCREPIDWFEEPLFRAVSADPAASAHVELATAAEPATADDPVGEPSPANVVTRGDAPPKRARTMNGGAPIKNKSKKKRKPRRSHKYKKSKKPKKSKKKKLPKRRTTRRA